MKSSNVWTPQVIATLVIWYCFSFVTIFLNKYILGFENSDPVILGSTQLIICTILSWWQFPPGTGSVSTLESRFSKLSVIVGLLRFSTLVLGLVALNYAPVSFAETVKSSAPVFTVIISWFFLSEPCSLLINLSLIPIVVGMALCSAFEIDLNMIALVASLATNFSECFQNVFSKKLLTSDRIDVHRVQLTTGLSSFLLQVPCLILLVDWTSVIEGLNDANLMASYLLCGVSFHLQSISEYVLLRKISPVTHSVANSVKRALFIWVSVQIYGNPVTLQGWIGTGLVVTGVLLYNKVRTSMTSSLDTPLLTRITPSDLREI